MKTLPNRPFTLGELDIISTANEELTKQAAQLEHLEQVAASRQAEIARLRGLLRRWQKSHYIVDITLGKDTTEALK